MNSSSKTLDSKNILYQEITKHLLDVSLDPDWNASLANLLNQYFDSNLVEIFSPLENKVFISNREPKINKSFEFLQYDEPYWDEGNYVIPLKGNGHIKISINLKDKRDVEKEVHVISLLALAIKNRNHFILTSSEKYINSLEVVKTLLADSEDLKRSLSDICVEISETLGVSRAQIKVFSNNTSSIYDNYLSSEYKVNGILEAISVAPKFEEEYCALKLSTEKEYVFDGSLEKSEIERLLSIQSAFIQPLHYSKDLCGLLILHQTNYKRVYKAQEKKYLDQVGFLLGFFLGKTKEANNGSNHSLNKNELMTSDEFLRHLGHLQLESNATNAPFSLLLIDIKGLGDINSKLGFVAGNLVISQTSRYLFRQYDSKHKVARYNNDEFVVIFEGVDNKQIIAYANKLRECLSNLSVLGVGPVEYNFSHATFPIHTGSTAELLSLLENAMVLAKSRGKADICSAHELLNKPDKNFILNKMPSIILDRSNLKTGPEMVHTIDEQLKMKKTDYSPDVLDSVQSLALALDAKDSYTEGHSQRVGEYSYLLAKHIGLSLQEQEWIRLAGIMHDIGKIGIPENILCKNGKLTKEEFEIMKKHPVISARILKPIKQLEKVANLVLYHHEYWDGSGYPHGYAKEEIPTGSMIVSIADAYQAMTSDRPYRAGLPLEVAFERLRAGKEGQWNPELVEGFISVVS